MAKMRSMVRCMTSRQVCFPVIFTIALISLTLTTLQFSGVTVTHRNWRRGEQHLVRSWNQEKADEKLNKITTVLNADPENIASLQKIKIPNFSVKKKQPNNIGIQDEKTNKVKNEKILTTRTTRATTMGIPHKNDVRIVRQWTTKHTKDSQKNAGKYLESNKNATYVKEKESPPRLIEDSTMKSEKDVPIQDTAILDTKTQKYEQTKVPVRKINKKLTTQTTRAKTTTTILPHKNDAQELRHEDKNQTNKSQIKVGNYSEFTESLKEILDADVNNILNVKDEINKQINLEPLPEQTKGVIIVTNYRSGSTFLGELFNQHPDSFYTFEPLYPFGYNCSFEPRRRVQVLHDMLKCDFPSMKKIYNDLNKTAKGIVHQGCVRNNFCFRYNHKDLCTKDLCPKGNTDKCTSCGPVNLPLVNNKCRARKMSVIKVIKLCFIQSLEPIFLDPSFDLKIIHLVRDPRGIASSRFKIHPDWDPAENIKTTCQRQAANVRAGRNIGWLKNRYKLVRYEDIATNPIESAKDIYNFVGLPFEDSVKEWILQNTRSRSKINENNILAKRNGAKNYDAAKDPYSTQRDSNAAMQAWRTHLSFQTVNNIQKYCFEALRSLGYKDFKTSSNLINLNVTSVLSL